MEQRESGTEQEEAERCGREASAEGGRGPPEEEDRRGVVVPAIGQRPAVPLVPFVAEPPIHVDVDQLGSRVLRHRKTR